MNRLRKFGLLGATSLMVWGCTSALKSDIRGALPDRGSFFLAESAGSSAIAAKLVRERLIGRGLVEERGGLYLVQIGLATRSPSSGMAVSNVPSQWLYPPARGSGRIEQLNVTLTMTSDGSEIFRGSIQKRNGRIDTETIDQLVDAIFVSIRKEPTGMHGVALR